MMKKLVLKYGYFLGIISQLILILVLMSLLTDVNEIFRYAARFSGRFSFSLYLLSVLSFLKYYTKNQSIMFTRKVLGIFSLIHLIHFYFLATSIYLNSIPIIPYRLAGGFIAYLMIIIYPFYINKINNKILHFIYFYYVGFIMVMTYISRIKGQFKGAEPEMFHYLAITFLIITLIVFSYKIYSKK
tara:strand:- start:503 stop:1060 length:558 start_codon:yes stop_codon:yes gene_type:complete